MASNNSVLSSNYINITTASKKRYMPNQQRKTQMENNRKYFLKAQNLYADILEKLSLYLQKDFLDNNSLIDSFVEHPEQLIALLQIQGGVKFDEAYALAEEFSNAYNTFFQVFAYCIEDAESIGEYINDTELNYGIALLNKNHELSTHVLDKQQTSDFIRNQSIFGIQRNRNGTFTFGMKEKIGTDIIEQGIIKATGDQEGGKNLAVQIFGQETLELQQLIFEKLASTRILTATAARLNEPGRYDRYEKMLKSKLDRGTIDQDTYNQRLMKRQRQMQSEVTLSRKLEGSYRLIIENYIQRGMSENEIMEQIDIMAKQGWKFSDNKPGVFGGDLTKKELQKIQSNTALLEARDISLKLGQDQRYNPDLYSNTTIFNVYDLILLQSEEIGVQQQINSDIGSGAILGYPEVRTSMEEQVGQFIDNAQSFFDSAQY